MIDRLATVAFWLAYSRARIAEVGFRADNLIRRSPLGMHTNAQDCEQRLAAHVSQVNRSINWSQRLGVIPMRCAAAAAAVLVVV